MWPVTFSSVSFRTALCRDCAWKNKGFFNRGNLKIVQSNCACKVKFISSRISPYSSGFPAAACRVRSTRSPTVSERVASEGSDFASTHWRCEIDRRFVASLRTASTGDWLRASYRRSSRSATSGCAPRKRRTRQTRRCPLRSWRWVPSGCAPLFGGWMENRVNLLQVSKWCCKIDMLRIEKHSLIFGYKMVYSWFSGRFPHY